MIEPTTDINFITDCITHPKVWAAAADDGCCDPGLFFMDLHKSMLWLRSDDDGVFMLHPHNSFMYECHTMLLPSAYGRSVEIAKEALEWAFKNTKAERIITNVPRFNALALRLSRKAGFVEFGVNPSSFKKNGVWHDQIMFGMNKEDICQQFH